jgi:hypothetical protein
MNHTFFGALTIANPMPTATSERRPTKGDLHGQTSSVDSAEIWRDEFAKAQLFQLERVWRKGQRPIVVAKSNYFESRQFGKIEIAKVLSPPKSVKLTDYTRKSSQGQPGNCISKSKLVRV